MDLPAGAARDVKALRMRIHNLTYADMVSVQVNGGEWVSLNNSSVAVAEPDKSYGGIGGAFSTLDVTLGLGAGSVVDGANTLSFRFNRSDGVASGFRVLSFNFLDSENRPLLPVSTFVQDDPSRWKPPISDSAAARAGKQLWENAALTPGEFKSSPMIRARCGDCHTRDGRDLKYFCYSNASIVTRSRFHGLSEEEGRQIASYIRSLDAPSPGRPWNPPYQPGPGLDKRPAAEWAAGAGLDWVLEKDGGTLAFLGGLTKETFRPDGNLNLREVPISFQMPDWNHWLPRVHPMDAWGTTFDKSEFAGWYGKTVAARSTAPAFDKWREARRAFLKPYVEGKVNWTLELGVKAYATQLWQLVKTWELTQEYSLESERTWGNTIPEATAPATVNIPDGSAGMGGSALSNEYFDAAWYELQILVNHGNHQHRDRAPVDWVYVIGRSLDLYRETKRPEPARVLTAVIRSMQSTERGIGPKDKMRGWRPRQNVDPSIMVSEVWKPIFAALSADERRAITESMLAAWVEKNEQFQPGEYFSPGVSDDSYSAPESLGGIVGGRVWEQAAAFRAAGVSADVVGRLQKWGRAYMDTAARFRYSDNSRRSGK